MKISLFNNTVNMSWKEFDKFPAKTKELIFGEQGFLKVRKNAKRGQMGVIVNDNIIIMYAPSGLFIKTEEQKTNEKIKIIDNSEDEISL